MKLICIQIDDTETEVEKEFRSFKALKHWLATMPGLFPKKVRTKWLEMTKSQFDSTPDGGALFITLTPEGTVYTASPRQPN
jgi:hypothetical protein